MSYGAAITLHPIATIGFYGSLFALLACSGSRPPVQSELSPGVVFPTSFGEGDGDPVNAAPLPKAPLAPEAVATKASDHGGLPDPEPLRLAEQWEYELEWSRGTLSVVSVAAKRFANPVVSARRMGRFAIELWIGQELVDRVRFDFPMLALEDTQRSTEPRSLSEPPSLSKGAEVRQKVLVPASGRARRAILVDRATSAVQVLPWPPNPAAAAVPPRPAPGRP